MRDNDQTKKIIEDLLYISNASSKYCVGFEGNISAKIDNGLIIKASGHSLKNLTSNDLIRFDFDGNQIDNLSKKGSMELGFHKFLLGLGFSFISHTHPIATTSILCSSKIYCEDFAYERFFPDQVIFNGKKSCLIPYLMPGIKLTSSIIENVNNFKINEGYYPKLILLKNHGIISCGKSAKECEMINDICEKSAEIYLNSLKYGINFLNRDEIEEISTDKKEIFRQNLI